MNVKAGKLLGFFLICWAVMSQSSFGQNARLDSLEQLARAQYRSNLDTSRAIAERVLQEANAAENHEKVAWAYNWIAICFLKNGLSDSVSWYLERCIEYCEAHAIEDIKGKARLNQSINLFQQGRYEEAVEKGLKALTVFEENGDSLGQAHAWYNTGLSYQRMDRPQKAMTFFQRALPVYLRKGGVLDRANTLNAIGSGYESLEKPDSALHYYFKAIQQKLDANAWAYCGSEYANVGRIYQEDGDSVESRKYYRKAFEAYDAIEDFRGLGLVSANLASFALADEQWDSAVYYGNISLKYLAESDDQFLLKHGHSMLAQGYEGQKKYVPALQHFKWADSLDNLMRNAEVQKNMDELLVKYETEKREKELAEAEVKSQRKSFWLAGAIAGIGALIVTLLLLIRAGAERKKRLTETARANLEAERNRISMDLHDHLGAELTIITSQLDTQSYLVADEDIKKQMADLAAQAREANAQLRETIWSVRTDKITLQQFELKLKEFASRMLAETKFAFESNREGNVDLRPSLALSLYRVVQEGISNARKYSGGTKIELHLESAGERLKIRLVDNGTGFSKDKITPGYGLANMEERIKELKGSFSLKTQSGTSIEIEVPVLD